MTHPDPTRVEAVARAIWEDRYPDESWDDIKEYAAHPEGGNGRYLTIMGHARAALAAADAHDAANGVVRVPIEPPPGLLVSMAICLNHGFGAPLYKVGNVVMSGMTDEQKRSMLSDMRKLYDEVVGRGYWRPERAGQYVAWGPPTPDAEGGG